MPGLVSCPHLYSPLHIHCSSIHSQSVMLFTVLESRTTRDVSACRHIAMSKWLVDSTEFSHSPLYLVLGARSWALGLKPYSCSREAMQKSVKRHFVNNGMLKWISVLSTRFFWRGNYGYTISSGWALALLLDLFVQHLIYLYSMCVCLCNPNRKLIRNA